MDSYQRFAKDVLKGYTWHFNRVQNQDLDEVQVAFACMISDLEYVDNFRIYPLWMKNDYLDQRDRGCCGSADSQVKCKSGNIYLIGCNYGH